MIIKTPQIRVLLGRCRKTVGLLVFGVFLFATVITAVNSVLKPQQVQALTNSNLNFQARLQTASGGIVPDGLYNIQFNLYSAVSGGTSLWTETYLVSNTQAVRVKNGYITTNLGSLTAFPGTINWDQELWLGMTVRGTGSCAFAACTPADAEMTPRLKITGVPYAFRAGQLATGNGTLQSTLQIIQPTIGNQVFRIRDQAAAGTYNLLTENEASSSYIQNTISPQTGNFNITGNGTVGGNMSVTGTYNTNTFNSTTLTFGGAAASIQSAAAQSLTIDSGTTGTLNIGTAASAKTIQLGTTTGAVAQVINVGTNATAASTTTLTLGSTIGASTTNIRAGSGGVNVLGLTNINTSGASQTNIGTGSSSGTITIGNQSTGNNLLLQAANIVLDAGTGSGGNLSFINNLSINGNYSQGGTNTTFQTGTGTTSFRGSTIGIGDATTDRTTILAQIQGAAPLVFQGATDNTFTTTLAVADPTANNTLTLPNYSGTVVASSNTGSTGECLKSTGATTAPAYGVCGVGSASTMQDTYNASGSTNPQIQLSSANGGLKLRDSATPIVGNLFQLQNSAGTVTHFGVSTAGISIQNTAGVMGVELLSSGQLKIYDPANYNGSNFASITYNGTTNTATFAASVGTTRVGNGSGNITMTLTNPTDVLAASKSLGSLGSAYSLKDFTFSRSIVAGATSLSGSVMSVESLSTSTGANDSTTILNLVQANTNNTGNLIQGTTGGAEKFKVTSNGSVTIAGNETYGSVGDLNISSGGAGGVKVKTNSNIVNAFRVQDSTGVTELQIDSLNGQYAFGANGVITGARLGVAGFGGLNILQLNTGGGAQVFTVDSTGDTLLKPTAVATNAFQVQNTSAANMFTVNTTNSRIEIGSSTTDATAITLVLDSYNNATDPAGVNGAMYYNSAEQQFRCYRDGAWEPCSTRPIDRAYTFDDEFASGAITATSNTSGIGNANWTSIQVGTNNCVNYVYNPTTGYVPTADRFGILRMQTSATTGASQGCRIVQGNTQTGSGGSTVVGAGQAIKAAVAVGATTNTVVRVGLDPGTTTGARQTSAGIWWEADPATSANWQYCFATGAAATCASSGIAFAANTMARLEIRVNATGSGTSSATFLVNGTAFNVTSVTINSSTTVRPSIMCSTSTTSAVSQACYADYFLFRADTSAAR